MSLRLAMPLAALALAAGACGGTEPPTTSSREATATSAPTPAPAAETTSSAGGGCVPALLEPDAGAVIDSPCAQQAVRLTWQFSWSARPGAESYHLRVIAAGAVRPTIDDPNLTVTAIKDERPGTLSHANRQSWYWRVRSKQSGVWNPWSEERTFATEPYEESCISRGE